MKLEMDKKNNQINFYSELEHLSQNMIQHEMYVLNSDFLMYETMPENNSFMNIEKYDIKNETMTLDYQFVLKDYTNETQVSIEFNTYYDKITLPLEKKSENVFFTKASIPLTNYQTINLIIEKTPGQTTIETVASDTNAEFLQYVLSNQIWLTVPTDETNNLQLDTIAYTPNFRHESFGIKFNGQLKGSLNVTLYNSDYELIDRLNTPLENEATLQLNQELPLNEKIYIVVDYSYRTKEELARGNFNTYNPLTPDGQVQEYFIITDNTDGPYTICHG